MSARHSQKGSPKQTPSRPPSAPDLDFETELHAQGFRHIAGLDEVGRGSLAGPAAAGAVILPQDPHPDLFEVVRDSKRLSAAQREEAYSVIARFAAAYAVGWSSPAEIDRVGIAPSVRRAMRRALAKLSPRPDHLLIDAVVLKGENLPQKSIIRGDSKSLSIAAASIVAKVERDRFMESLAEKRPEYGFDSHKGYGTERHVKAITERGPCRAHRMSFAPVKREAHRIEPVPSHLLGRWAESFAASELKDEGVKILDRNFRTRFGEVDLIAQQGETIRFIEVRARKSAQFGSPAESVTYAKSRRVIAASQAFLQRTGRDERDWQIDVASVELDSWSRPVAVEFIENAVEE